MALSPATHDGAMVRRLPLAESALAAYFAAMVAVAVLPVLGITEQSLVGALAFSPADLVSGRLWLLPLSGVIVDGTAWSQLVELAEGAAALVLLGGAGTFWRAAIAGHVGSTLIAYAVLGVLAMAAPASVGDLFRDPDYGVSCVWAGCLGALAVVAARRCRSRRAKVAVVCVACGPLVSLLQGGFVTQAGTVDLATLEHLLAFGLGALVAGASARGPAPTSRSRSLRASRTR
jgi:hypothetical protein